MQSMSLVDINSSILLRRFDFECYTHISSQLIKVPRKLRGYFRIEILNN